MMRRGLLALLACLTATDAAACSIFFDERPVAELRRISAPATMDRQCRMINGGVHDTLTLGRAQHAGDGRFIQVVGDYSQSLIYVADCKTREATLLRGKATQTAETSCGPSFSYADLAGPDAMMSLSEGEDLHALVEIAKAQGVTEQNPLDYFFTFTRNAWEDPVPVGPQDRFDLMCGCKHLFPDTPGAE